MMGPSDTGADGGWTRLELVGAGRFELPTYRLGGGRSIHLSYAPTSLSPLSCAQLQFIAVWWASFPSLTLCGPAPPWGPRLWSR